jgi:WD40 repeat protein
MEMGSKSSVCSPAIKYHTTLAEYFSAKPLYLDEAEKMKPNTRKLVELPWQQLLSDLTQYFRTMTDFTFLHTKVLVLGLPRLLEDYNSFLDRPDIRLLIKTTNFRYLDELRRSLELSAHILDRRREEFSAQLVGRLRDSHDNPCMPDLLDQANWAAKQSPHLLPRTASLTRSGGRYLRSLIGHDDMVNALTLTRDQRYLVSSGDDGRLLTWDLEGGYRSRELVSSHGNVRVLASLNEPNLFVAGSSTGMLSVWDATSGLCMCSMRGVDSGGIKDLCVLGDGRVAAAADKQGHVIIWDSRTQACVMTSPSQHDFVHSLATAYDGAWLVSGHKNGWLRVWDTKTGTLVREFQAHDENDIAEVVVLHQGPYALTTNKLYLRLWNLLTGVQVCEWRLDRLTYGMTYNPWNDELMLFAGLQGLATLDESLFAITLMKKADSALEWEAAIKYQCENYNSPVTTFVLADSGRMGFSGDRDGVIRQWDLCTNLAQTTQERHTCPVHTIAFFPGHQRVVTGASKELSGRNYLNVDNDLFAGIGRVFSSTNAEPDDFSIRCWDTRSGRCEDSLTPHNDRIYRLAALPDGKTVISTAGDGRMAISHFDSIQESSIINKVGRVFTVSSDGRTVVSEGEKHTLVLIDTSTGIIRHYMKGHRDLVTGIVIHPDLQKAVSAGRDGHVMLWDLLKGKRLADVIGHKKWIEELKITPDGCYALTTSQANELKMWQIGGHTLREVTVKAEFGRLLAISPDGQAVLSVNSEGIKLWSLPHIKISRESIERLSWAEFLPDGSAIIGLHIDGYLLLLGAEKLDCLASFTSDTTIRIAAFGRQQRMVVAGDDGGRVHFLDLLWYPSQLPIAVQVEQHKWLKKRRRIMLCPICGSWTQHVINAQNRCAVCGQLCRVTRSTINVCWYLREVHNTPI